MTKGQPVPAWLWSGQRLRAGAKRAFSGQGILCQQVAKRLVALRERVQARPINHPVVCPPFGIDPSIVDEFRKFSTEDYWKRTLANHNGEQNARPLPAYQYMERDWNAFITPFNQIRDALAAMMELSIAGFAFDDEALLERGLAIWRDLVAWPKGGLCDEWHGDTIATRLCARLARVARWQEDRLTDADWCALESTLTWRFEEALEFYKFFEIARFPYDSHIASAVSNFGGAVLAMEQRLPTLTRFGNWVRESVEPIFPVWGGADGGWAAGINYWRWSAGQWLLLADLYPDGHALAGHPWIRQTGFFKLYTHPPYSHQGAFGDHGDVPPLPLDAATLLYLGARYGIADLVWYAEEWAKQPPHHCPDPGPSFSEAEALAMELAALASLEPISYELSPTLPGSRHFEDTGIIASHTHLGDKAKDVMLLFRSSRWGSFNHAHADQNSFIVEAWGEPLLIDAGYYPLYHHPHMKNFTIQTAAHNAVLINGIGQTIRNLHATGKITHFESTPESDRWTGDATTAYGGRCDQALRHMWFDKEERFIIILDAVTTPHPHSLDWLLHSYEPFVIDEKRATVEARGWHQYGGSARAKIHLLEPGNPYFQQTDEFPVPADMRESGKAKQYQLKVTSRAGQRESVFLAVIQIGREETNWLEPQIYNDGEIRSLRIGQKRFLCDPDAGISKQAFAL